ncbi:hypothetical protein Tco_1067989 [Tanacetum coccineum]|uniref:Uncharacterized protein n=1 Tax=Tanacetum coccineum TaxID=301880 RepID=A0ABQ5HGE0_9ASTR
MLQTFIINAGKRTSKIIRNGNLKLKDVIYSGGCSSLNASSVTKGASLEANLFTEGITLDASLVGKQSIVDSRTSSEQQLESNSSKNECNRLRNENKSSDNERNSAANDVDVDIRPSYDSDTVSEVHHDMFENVFTHRIQNHEQPKSIPNTYVVNENNSNIIFDIPNMDPDRGKEDHDAVDYEQQRDLFASLINNLKACKKDKTFDCENGKFDEYVQPLLKRKNELEKKNQELLKQINALDNRLQKAGQTDQTLRMLLPKKDNVQTGKQGLGSENKYDVETLVY